MRALTYGSFLLVAFSTVVSCGEDDDGGGGSSGSGGKSTTGPVSCPANPMPGDTCTTNGTCSNAPGCFCLSGSISCSDSPPPTGGSGGTSSGTGGTNPGGGDVDCGNDPETGENCDDPGQCQGSDDCFCDGDEVQCIGFGGTADCGANPMTGAACSGGTGLCEGSQTCVCFDEQVQCN